MPPPVPVLFCGRTADAGGVAPQWRVQSSIAVSGEDLPAAQTLSVLEGDHSASAPEGTVWHVRSATSNLRYTTRTELAELVAKQEGLNRPDSTCGAIILIKKSEAWWAMTQEERREMIAKGGHIGHGAFALDSLPAIARRLHHCREFGEQFDFVTWFEFAPADAGAFDELVRKLRATEEWGFVEREVDIRLVRACA